MYASWKALGAILGGVWLQVGRQVGAKLAQKSEKTGYQDDVNKSSTIWSREGHAAVLPRTGILAPKNDPNQVPQGPDWASWQLHALETLPVELMARGAEKNIIYKKYIYTNNIQNALKIYQTYAKHENLYKTLYKHTLKICKSISNKKKQTIYKQIHPLGSSKSST